MARLGRLVLLWVALVAWPFAAGAEQAAVVTVTGTVANANRPPFDPFVDTFFAHYDIKFDKAHAFSLPDLARLHQVTVALRYPNWPKRVVFRGPRLRDVLAAAGASGKTVTAQALDGYMVEMPASALSGDKVVLAIEADGRPLAIGGRGPAWLVFPPGTVPDQDRQSDAQLVWAVFHIRVQ